MSWRAVTFGDICEFKYGKALSAQVRNDGDVAVYGSNGQVGMHDLPLSSGPTIIIGRKGSVGEVHYCDGPNWPIDTTYFIDHSSTECDLKWLAYALRSSRIRTLNKAAAVPGLNRNDAYLEPVLLPPLAEQKRIAAILDKADQLHQKRRQAITFLDNLTQSIFLEMFGDPVCNPKSYPTLPLADLLSEIQSGWSPSCLDRPAVDGEWGVLKLSAVTSGTFRSDEQKALPPELAPRTKLEVRKGDILFTRKNTYDLVAACAWVDNVRPKLMISDLIFRLVIRDPGVLAPAFLWATLTNPNFRRQVQALAGGAAGSMPNISKERLRAVEIPLPNALFQHNFMDRVVVLRNQLKKFHLQLRNTEELLSGLQQTLLQRGH
ncbi:MULTISPECIES: restriction endonuclease subunit S [Rhizobium]|uniref:restriction endonuclease subunit S n=1 Tax=Rhizobium TaxID=379 RepID=UPI001C830310|nr:MULTISPECIES: restriction endonuclease subunit S [Rhizobium]MBX4963976.1 hypothetical protein [Rhizobium binae]MBY3595992.1 restriction endonuclease subunit S [Rhizobium bangladeshense]